MDTSNNKVTVIAYGDRSILITRSFKAPKQLVFDAMSKPEMMKHWFHGAPGWSLTACEMDLRVGGSYRWAWTNAEGQEMGMGGRVLELAPPDRLVLTEKFDQAWYPGEARSTMDFEEKDGITTMRLTVEYESAEARDGVLKIPMADGMEVNYARLDAYLLSSH